LESITNRNPQQEQELNDLKEKLAKLESSSGKDPKKTDWTPWIIGGIMLVVVIGVIIYLLARKKEK